MNNKETEPTSLLIGWFLILYSKAKEVNLGQDLHIEDAVQRKESFIHYVKEGKFESKTLIYKLARPRSKVVMTVFILTPNGFIRVKYNLLTKEMVFIASEEVSKNIEGWKELTASGLISEVVENDGALFSRRIMSKAGIWPSPDRTSPQAVAKERYRTLLESIREGFFITGTAIVSGEQGSGIADIIYETLPDNKVAVHKRSEDDELAFSTIETEYVTVPRY